jgi:hypothetical protein
MNDSKETGKQQKQPQKHAPKTQTDVYMRRKKIIKGLVEGKNLKEIGIETGLSPKTASSQVSRIVREPQTQRMFIELLDKAGCTDSYLAKKIQALSKAKKKLFFAHQGKVTDEKEVDALEIQADMTKFAAKVKGYVTDKSQVQAPGIEDILREIMDRRSGGKA